MIFLSKDGKLIGCIPESLEGVPCEVLCKDCAVRGTCRWSGATIIQK